MQSKNPNVKSLLKEDEFTIVEHSLPNPRITELFYSNMDKAESDCLVLCTNEKKETFGACQTKGRRRNRPQEDAFSMTISRMQGYETLTSEMRRKITLIAAYEFQKKYGQDANQGTTAAIGSAFLQEKIGSIVLHFFSSSLGDSTVCSIVEQNGEIKCQRINRIHSSKEEKEKQRVLDENGLIYYGRLCGELDVSGSFGDRSFSLGGITYYFFMDETEIEIKKESEEKPKAWCGIFSDGVTKALTENQIATVVRKHQDSSPDMIAEAIVEQALNNARVKDHLTAVLFSLSPTLKSGAVYDGHGGSKVSSDARLHFYSILQTYILKAQTPEGIAEINKAEENIREKDGIFIKAIKELYLDKPETFHEVLKGPHRNEFLNLISIAHQEFKLKILFYTVKNGIDIIKDCNYRYALFEYANSSGNVTYSNEIMDDNFNTCLFYAIRSNQLTIVEQLLAFTIPPDINKRNRNYETPLILAYDNKFLEIIKLLVKKGVRNQAELFKKALEEHNKDVIEAMIAGGFSATAHLPQSLSREAEKTCLELGLKKTTINLLKKFPTTLEMVFTSVDTLELFLNKINPQKTPSSIKRNANALIFSLRKSGPHDFVIDLDSEQEALNLLALLNEKAFHFNERSLCLNKEVMDITHQLKDISLKPFDTLSPPELKVSSAALQEKIKEKTICHTLLPEEKSNKVRLFKPPPEQPYLKLYKSPEGAFIIETLTIEQAKYLFKHMIETTSPELKTIMQEQMVGNTSHAIPYLNPKNPKQLLFPVIPVQNSEMKSEQIFLGNKNNIYFLRDFLNLYGERRAFFAKHCDMFINEDEEKSVLRFVKDPLLKIIIPQKSLMEMQSMKEKFSNFLFRK